MGVLAVCGCAAAQDGAAGEVEAAAAAQAQPEGESVPESMASEAKEQLTTFRLPAPDWRVKIEPRVWWVSPNGEVKLPAASGTGPGGFTDSGQSVDVSRLNLDTPRLSAAGSVEIAAERWRFAFSAGGFSLDRDETTADAAFRIGSVEVSPGEAMRTRMDYATFELTMGYEVWSRDFAKASKRPEDAMEASLRLILLGGGRIHDLDVDVESLADGTSAETDQTYFEAMGGMRLEAELLERFSMSFQASGGLWVESDRSIYSFDMQVAFGWEPVDHVELEIGWRQMLFSMSDGEDSPATEEFEFTGGMAGLFFGVVVRF
jgi:hypothetical protein